MRLLPAIAIVALWTGGVAVAQTPPPAPAGIPAGIGRDAYIAKAQERAAKSAATRFDEMDADHDGILTPDEIRAYRAAHPRHRTGTAPAAQ